MLLQANPGSIREVINDQRTALQLAMDTATKSHPNYALIEALESAMCGGDDSVGVQVPSATALVGSASFSSARNDEGKKKRKAKGKNSSRAVKAPKATPSKKRKRSEYRESADIETMDTPVAADLLLHFSRSNNAGIEHKPEMSGVATQVAEV